MCNPSLVALSLQVPVAAILFLTWDLFRTLISVTRVAQTHGNSECFYGKFNDVKMTTLVASMSTFFLDGKF